MKYIKTFNESLEKSIPVEKDIPEVVDYLKNRYEIFTHDMKEFGISKYIIVDDKNTYLTGSLSNKTRAVNKIYNAVSSELSKYGEGTIRKGIKKFIDSHHETPKVV